MRLRVERVVTRCEAERVARDRRRVLHEQQHDLLAALATLRGGGDGVACGVRRAGRGRVREAAAGAYVSCGGDARAWTHGKGRWMRGGCVRRGMRAWGKGASSITCTARWSGVLPATSAASMSAAWCSMSCSAAFSAPHDAQRCSGVCSFESAAEACALAASSCLTTASDLRGEEKKRRLDGGVGMVVLTDTRPRVRWR